MRLRLSLRRADGLEQVRDGTPLCERALGSRRNPGFARGRRVAAPQTWQVTIRRTSSSQRCRPSPPARTRCSWMQRCAMVFLLKLSSPLRTSPTTFWKKPNGTYTNASYRPPLQAPTCRGACALTARIWQEVCGSWIIVTFLSRFGMARRRRESGVPAMSLRIAGMPASHVSTCTRRRYELECCNQTQALTIRKPVRLVARKQVPRLFGAHLRPRARVRLRRAILLPGPDHAPHLLE